MLIFLGSHPLDRSVQTALDALGRHAFFNDERALLVGISTEAVGHELSPQEKSGQLYLLDASGAIANGYGVIGLGAAGPAVRPTAFILSPALQIIGIVPLTGPAEEFVDQIVSLLAARIENPPAASSAPLLIVPQVFDRALCRRLVDLYDAAGGREIGVVESKGVATEHFDPRFRKRSDHYISDKSALKQTQEALARRLLPIVYRAFQFQVTRIERYLVGCYDAATGGYFKPHRDNTAPVVAHRRFALTINLNEDYEGGSLRFPEFSDQPHRAAPGDAIVFSCSLLHEVAPVTRHRRYAFLSFLYDEQGQRIREANQAKVAASLRR